MLRALRALQLSAPQGLLPGVFLNTVRPPAASLVLLNSSVVELPLELSLSPVTEGKVTCANAGAMRAAPCDGLCAL